MWRVSLVSALVIALHFNLRNDRNFILRFVWRTSKRDRRRDTCRAEHHVTGFASDHVIAYICRHCYSSVMSWCRVSKEKKKKKKIENLDWVLLDKMKNQLIMTHSLHLIFRSWDTLSWLVRCIKPTLNDFNFIMNVHNNLLLFLCVRILRVQCTVRSCRVWRSNDRPRRWGKDLPSAVSLAVDIITVLPYFCF